ncbi:MAG: organic hydroperoxide resistance protein [Rhodospirillales bacterium]
MEVLYKTQATAKGGRDGGRSTSADGVLDVRLVMPKELGGPGGSGTNPEQLFAAGYAACFLSAIKFVAGQEKLKVSDDASVTAEVGIGQVPGGFGLDIALKAHLPGLDAGAARALVEKAHTVCPYSNATRNNVPVRLDVV